MIGPDFTYCGRPWQKHYAPSTSPELSELKFKNIAEMFQQASQKYGAKKAFQIELPNGMSASLSFLEVQEHADSFAFYLREVLGLKEGDRIAIQMPNCLAYPVCVFGALQAGCVIVNTNPLYTPHEMEYQFADSQARVLVIIDLMADKLKDIIQKTKIEKVVLVRLVDFFPKLKGAFVQSVLKYAKKSIPPCPVPHDKFMAALAAGKKAGDQKRLNTHVYWANLNTDAVCALQYTGGTTGVSKGAVLSHRNILSNVDQIFELGKDKIISGSENILTVLPLYHIFAFTLNLLTFYHVGGLNILIPNPRPLSNLKKAFQKNEISWISGVNTLFNGLLNEPWFDKHCTRALKASIAGGTALHRSVAETWQQTTGTSVVEGYGLSETSPVVTFNPISGMVKAETVGVPAPSTEVAILDDNGEPTPLGEPGEIVVRGPQVMSGYWNKPEENKKILKNGWFFTGDVAFMDEDGYIKIVDRKKDMILVSGFNVYPNEVEDCISKHPEVQEVAVIGVPSDHTGECVKAYIVPKNNALQADEILRFCKKYLTSYKMPKVIEFTDNLPKTPVGKILRKVLKEQEKERCSTP